MKNITGIILCGGKSCRFGEDKGLCTLAGKPMIEYPLSALNSICDEILISSNDPRYDNMGYKVIKDNIKNIGPIGGIFSALQQSKTEDNLIVSCDMPFVNEKLLNYILDNKNDHLVAAAFEGQYVEPLCSYYNKKVLPLI
ncbi:MAG TPA: molybdenum cofactor guanylyltransferase, partial [Bacteroidetes bacterium]|nr:molybdenum cofactor guanylyltransferase [Bacteroidota bacterium]